MSAKTHSLRRKWISFLLLSACSATTLSIAAESTDATSVGNSGGATAPRNPAPTITIGNFTFEPKTLTVTVGTELTWINEDDAPHTVIGTEKDSAIRSKPLGTDDRYSLKLSKPGTYRYFCSLHPHMTGTIVVE